MNYATCTHFSSLVFCILVPFYGCGGGGGGGDINTQNANVLSAVGARAGAASEAAELRKHTAND